MTATHTALCSPIFWAHGTADLDIPLQNAWEVMQWLRTSLHIDDKGLSYHEYSGLGHGVNNDVLRDLGTWFDSLL
jgi:predicted esterase